MHILRAWNIFILELFFNLLKILDISFIATFWAWTQLYPHCFRSLNCSKVFHNLLSCTMHIFFDILSFPHYLQHITYFLSITPLKSQQSPAFNQKKAIFSCQFSVNNEFVSYIKGRSNINNWKFLEPKIPFRLSLIFRLIAAGFCCRWSGSRKMVLWTKQVRKSTMRQPDALHLYFTQQRGIVWTLAPTLTLRVVTNFWKFLETLFESCTPHYTLHAVNSQ